MADQNSQTTQGRERQELTPAFGGVIPNFEEAHRDAAPTTDFAGVSLVDDKAGSGLVSLVSNQSAQPPRLTDEELTHKLDRFAFALGKDVSKDDIQSYLTSGNEAQLRVYAAARQDQIDEQTRQTTLKEILSEGLPQTPLEQQMMYGNVKALNGFAPKNDPNTILEQAYARNFIETLPTVGPEDSAINRLIGEVTDKALTADRQQRIHTAKNELLSIEEAGVRIKLYQENAKDVLERAEQRYAKESLFGKIVDFGKSALPFYDYYNTVMDTPGMQAVGVTPGATIAQWVTKLYDQPPAVQKQWLEQAVDTIGAYNPALAVRVAEAAVSYSTTDQALDNVFGLLDLPGPGSVKAAKAAVVGGLVALSTRHEAANAVKAAIRASADPRVTPGEFNEAMGDLNAAALHNVVTTPPGGPESPSALSRLAPSFINPTAAPGSSKGFSAALTGRLADYVSKRAEDLRAKIDRAPRINRKPEEALQAAYLQTDLEFREAISQSVNNAIQNVVHRPAAPKPTFNESKIDAYISRRSGKPFEFEKTRGENEPELPATKSALAEPNPEGEARLDRLIGKRRGEDFDFAATKRPDEAPVDLSIKGTPVRPEDTPENLGRWEYEISKPSGELFSGEHWQKDMHKWARLMGFDVGDYGARAVGNGWVMTMSVPLDETRPFVRDHLVKTKNTQTPMSGFFSDWLRRGGGRVSEFSANNRIAYVVGQEKMREIIEPLAKDLLRLDADATEALNRVMTDEMNRLDPSSNLPGYFFEDLGEFDDAYRRLVGRSPTEKETSAYLAARTLNDLEFGLRRSSYYKELARQGLKVIELRTQRTDAETGFKTFDTVRFEGKVIDKLPLDATDSRARAMVTLYHEGEEKPRIVPLHALLTEKGKGYVKELQDNGYKVIQTGNPVSKPGKEVFGEEESVNFIITRDFKTSALDVDRLFKYRGGWHSINPQKHFAKQPKVRRIEKTDDATGRTSVHHNYEGDVVHMGFHSEKEAQKYADAMEKARRIAFEGLEGDLDRHLAETLPYSRKSFMKLFEGDDPRFSKTEPFLSLNDGFISMDVYKERMTSRYEDLYDAIRSPWNLMNQVDKKFVGHRDEALHSIREGKGSQGDPVFKLVQAERLDPLAAMSYGISNMIRNQHMIDLRLQVGESWIKEFKHLLDPESEQVLYNDLVGTIMKPPYLTNIANSSLFPDYQRAENARLAFLELMNLETPFQAKMENLRSKVINHLYETRGQKASNEWATSSLFTTRNPLAFLRGAVYNWKVGMLNPMPALQNCMQIANVVGISPKHGPAGFTYGFFAWLSDLNGDKTILRTLGGLAEKASGGGYKSQWFEDAVQSMKESGYWAVGGGRALADHLNDPRPVRTKAGEVLDATSVLFTGSDRLLRTTAYMTAYLEHKAANPTKTLTSIDKNAILGRANLYAGRMTRDEKARWQSGEVLSTITQFWSYQARLMEMIWEKGHGRKDTLTTAEKMRLLATNSLLYGLPIGGLGTALGGFVNSYDHIKKELTERGINVDDGVLAMTLDGLAGTISKQLSGVNVSPALGPTGRDLTQSLDQDLGWFRFVTGPSGGLVLDLWKSAKPAWRSFQLALSGDVNPTALKTDLLDIARNVSSIDKLTKLYLAWTNHKVYTKAGRELGEIDDWGGLVYAITGELPEKLDHQKWEAEVLGNLPKIKEDLAKQAAQDLRLKMEALNKGDYETAAFYARRANIYLKDIASLTERAEIGHKAFSETKSLSETIPPQWEKHNPTISEGFRKAYGKYFNLPSSE